MTSQPLRRAAATVVDYTLIALWALVLLGVFVVTGAHVALADLGPGAGQLLGMATLSVPATVALAVSESRGGSPGKRMLRLRLVTSDARQPGRARAAGRTAGKVVLPWELAHAGAWQLTAGSGVVGTGLVIAAYVVLGIAVVGMLRGEPWYDRLCRTRVVDQQEGTL